MCLASILVEGLSSDEKTVLMRKRWGRGFGTGSAPINVINVLVARKLAQRMGYEDKYGRPSWVLTYCGRKAGLLLVDIEDNPLLRLSIEAIYDSERKDCPYLRKNPDEQLRNFEREFMQDPTWDNFSKLQTARIRAGIQQHYHDCDSCVFLGSGEQEITRNYDYYFCGSGSSGGSLIARYGDDGDYSSWPVDVLGSILSNTPEDQLSSHLREAVSLARKARLLS